MLADLWTLASGGDFITFITNARCVVCTWQRFMEHLLLVTAEHVQGEAEKKTRLFRQRQ